MKCDAGDWLSNGGFECYQKRRYVPQLRAALYPKNGDVKI